MIFKTFLLRFFQCQSQSRPIYSVIRPVLIDNFNQTKPFHHLQNTNYLNKSFLTGYDERYHFNKVEIEEPTIEDIVKNHLQFELLQTLSNIGNYNLVDQYIYDTITGFNITNGGLYDDWNNDF
jgi:hypothetical protein